MLLGYLLLSHLIGDFIFQPTKLVLWKMKSKKGVFLHVVLHFFISVIVLLPYLIEKNFWLLGVILGISFTHFWIDQAKIDYDIKHDEKVLPFVIDQLLHILTILIVFFFIKDHISFSISSTFLSIYTDKKVLFFIAGLILVSKVVEIYRFQKLREKNKNAKFKMNSDKMLSRIVVMTLIYGIFLLMSSYIGF